MKISIKELNPTLWRDLEELFGEKGACGGWGCMCYRIEKGEKCADVKGAEAKRRLKAMVRNGTVAVSSRTQTMSQSVGAHSVNELIFPG